MQIETMLLELLSEDPDNAREHPEENMASIRASLERFGQRAPLVVRDGVVVAGNGRLRAMRELGWTEAAVTSADDLNYEEAKAFALVDNRSSELAQWDDVKLMDGLRAASQVEGLGKMMQIDMSALANASRMVDVSSHQRDLANRVTQDETPDPPKTAITKLGDLWELGRHRLGCGDATKESDVALVLDGATPRLMVTDPPYGVEYDPEWRIDIEATGNTNENTATDGVVNDDRVDWSAAWRLFVGPVAYVWHAGIQAGQVVLSLESAGLIIRSQIVWVKQGFVFGRGHYHWQHEPCWYAVRKGTTAEWIGDRKQSTVWKIDNANLRKGGAIDDMNTTHSTQKPIECMARPIRNHAGDVYDPFLGSGTTLTAAEQLERICYGIELEPRYCDVIVERWQNLTGGKARRIKA